MHTPAFNWMALNKVVKAIFWFSGSNDEGGIDQAKAYNALDEEMEVNLGNYENLTPLFEDAESVLDSEYGGFAGDFSVTGTITYSLRSRKVTMRKSEQDWGAPVSHEV